MTDRLAVAALEHLGGCHNLTCIYDGIYDELAPITGAGAEAERNTMLVVKIIAVVGIAALTWMYPFFGAITLSVAYGLFFVLRRRQ